MMRQYTTGTQAALAALAEAQKHEEEMVDLFIEMLPESFINILERRLYNKKYYTHNQLNQQIYSLGNIFGGQSTQLSNQILQNPAPSTAPSTSNQTSTTVQSLSLGSSNTSTSLLGYVYGLFK